MQNLGERIRGLRKERGLSIEQLSFESDLSPLAVGNIERKSIVPSREHLIRILNCLSGVSPISVDERNKLLSICGYTDRYDRPSRADINRSVFAWNNLFMYASMPAYLIDMQYKICTCNDALCLLTRMSRDKICSLRSVFDLMFSLDIQKEFTFLNLEELTRENIVYIVRDIERFSDLEWYYPYLTNLVNQYPTLKEEYEHRQIDSTELADFSVMNSAVIKTRDSKELSFRVVSIDVPSDQRFCSIQWVPADSTTADQLSKILLDT